MKLIILIYLSLMFFSLNLYASSYQELISSLKKEAEIANEKRIENEKKLERKKSIENELENKVNEKNVFNIIQELTEYETDRLSKYLEYKELYQVEYNFNVSNYNIELQYQNSINEFFKLLSFSDNAFKYSLKNVKCDYNIIKDNENKDLIKKEDFFSCELNDFYSKNLIVNLDKKYDELNFKKLSLTHIPNEYEYLENNILEPGIILFERKKHLMNKVNQSNNMLEPENIYQALSFKDGNKRIKKNLYNFLYSINEVNASNLNIKTSYDYNMNLNVEYLNIKNFNELSKVILTNKLEDFLEPKIIEFEIKNPKIDFSLNILNYLESKYFQNYFNLNDIKINKYFSDRYQDFFKYLFRNKTLSDNLVIKGKIEIELLSKKNNTINYLNVKPTVEITHPKFGNIRIEIESLINVINLKFKSDNIFDELIVKMIDVEFDTTLLLTEYQNYINKFNIENKKDVAYLDLWKQDKLKIQDFFTEYYFLFENKKIKEEFEPFLFFNKHHLKVRILNKKAKRIKDIKPLILEKIEAKKDLNDEFLFIFKTF